MNYQNFPLLEKLKILLLIDQLYQKFLHVGLVYANQPSEKSDNIFTPKFLSLTFQSHFPLSFEMEWKRFVFLNWS